MRYGAAFVLLAYADRAEGRHRGKRDRGWTKPGSCSSHAIGDAAAGLYRDEADPQWHFSPYRGQNANMHLCEAMIAAYEASGGAHFLNRAFALAHNITRRQAAKTGGLIWETLQRRLARSTGTITATTPKNLFRPVGDSNPAI